MSLVSPLDTGVFPSLEPWGDTGQPARPQLTPDGRGEDGASPLGPGCRQSWFMDAPWSQSGSLSFKLGPWWALDGGKGPGASAATTRLGLGRGCGLVLGAPLLPWCVPD